MFPVKVRYITEKTGRTLINDGTLIGFGVNQGIIKPNNDSELISIRFSRITILDICNKRKVEYFNGHGSKRKKLGEAIFHQFGCTFCEFDTGPGNYSTAIIELDDGKVLNIDAENIKFIVPLRMEK